MTNPNLPPEIVAKWRIDFEQEHSFPHQQISFDGSRYKHEYLKHSQMADQLSMMLGVWIKARQSVVIELPETIDTTYLDDVFEEIHVIRAIEAQGYAVSRE